MSQLAARLATKYRDQIDDEAAQIITSIVDGSERMQMLINDLLEYSRTYRDPLERRPVDCAAVLTETLDLLADTIAEKGGTVTHDPMPTISANPIQIGKVFQNLLSNAIKFSDGLPRVHFAARQLGRILDDAGIERPRRVWYVARAASRASGSHTYSGGRGRVASIADSDFFGCGKS